MLAGRPLDLLLFLEESFEIRIRFLEQGAGVSSGSSAASRQRQPAAAWRRTTRRDAEHRRGRRSRRRPWPLPWSPCPRRGPCRGGCCPCRATPSRRCGRRWCGPRGGRSRCRRGSVCSGTRPSRYHSVRAISEPPRRPEHCTRMPRAPAFWAFWTARFMARRNATRPASWSATPCAISAASSSGCLISWMLSCTFGLPVIFVSPARRRSASEPRRPITMPGRAVCTSTRRRSRVRSTSTRLIAACGSWVIR